MPGCRYAHASSSSSDEQYYLRTIGRALDVLDCFDGQVPLSLKEIGTRIKLPETTLFRVLLTLEKPTKPMREEAADAGRYQSKLWHDKDYPKIQILTVEGLLSGTERVEAPPQTNPFTKAQREAKPERQADLM